MPINLVGLVMLDLILISMAWILPIVDPELFTAVEYILIGLTSLTLLTVLLSSKGGESLEKIISEHQDRPQWWNVYDVLTDIAFVLSWALNGAIGLALLYMVHKAMFMVKMPEYYDKKGDI